MCSRHGDEVATHFLGGASKTYHCERCIKKYPDRFGEADTIKEYLEHYYNKAVKSLESIGSSSPRKSLQMALDPFSQIKLLRESVLSADCGELRRIGKDMEKESKMDDDNPLELDKKQVMRQLWNCPPDTESLQISMNKVLQLRFVSQYQDLKDN